MHRALLIREILFDVFGYCSPEDYYDPSCHLAVLARTCQTFKEPALDLLWKTLFDLSPLARCLPEACKFDGRCYSFSRPLSEAEWNILRGYTCRVRSIRESDVFAERTIVLPKVPFTEPLFPNLRTLSWGWFITLPVEHITVPSLTSLSFGLLVPCGPLLMETLDTIGERCPNIRRFGIFFTGTGPLDATISRQLCRWSSLQCADCPRVTLTMDVILHLPSLSTLKRLSFTLSADLGNYTTHPGSTFVLSSLAKLNIKSASLKSVTTLFSRMQLPKIKDLDVTVSEYTSQWDVREYWTAVQMACASNTLSCLVFISNFDDEIKTLPVLDEQSRPWLTLHDLLPCKDFGNLHKIDIDVPWSVNLTDADILDLVSTSPHLEQLDINRRRGWKMDSEGGITLSGLVQLLQQCPSLGIVSLVIDIRTFTQIPHGLDVSFPTRQTHHGTLALYCLDSRKSNPDCESVFEALKLRVCYGMSPRSRL